MKQQSNLGAAQNVNLLVAFFCNESLYPPQCLENKDRRFLCIHTMNSAFFGFFPDQVWGIALQNKFSYISWLREGRS